MKRPIIITIVAVIIMSLAFIKIPKKSVVESDTKKEMKGEFSPVVVLELFTSEGCSSCPSADDLLPQLAKMDADIIPLSFHVDYWNRLGWKDPFSNPSFSERQRDYGRHFNNESVYTPQLVINGKYEMVGSSKTKTESIIKKALKENSSVELSIENFVRNGNKITIKSHAKGEFKNNDLDIALVQKMVTMDIKAGENKGVKLTHTNVVRVFTTQILKDDNEINLIIPDNLQDSNWEVILYTQRRSDLKITGGLRFWAKK